MLLGYAGANAIRIDVSDAILDETMRVLRDKFAWSGEMTHFTRLKILSIANLVVPERNLAVIAEDPDDDRILECAVTAKSDYLVTEDKHLLRRVQFESTRIVRIREFIEIAI